MVEDRSAHGAHEIEGEERPMSRERLDTPEMQARIAKAKERAATGGSDHGSTADDLVELARERRSMDARP